MQEGRKVLILAPLVRGRKGQHADAFQAIRRAGLIRARVDGQVVEVTDDARSSRRPRPHDIEAVVDRLVVREGIRPRLAESIDLALKLGEGTVLLSAQAEPALGRPLAERPLRLPRLRDRASRSSSRGRSASTAPMAPARPATAWASSRTPDDGGRGDCLPRLPGVAAPARGAARHGRGTVDPRGVRALADRRGAALLRDELSVRRLDDAVGPPLVREIAPSARFLDRSAWAT